MLMFNMFMLKDLFTQGDPCSVTHSNPSKAACLLQNSHCCLEKFVWNQHKHSSLYSWLTSWQNHITISVSSFLQLNGFWLVISSAWLRPGMKEFHSMLGMVLSHCGEGWSTIFFCVLKAEQNACFLSAMGKGSGDSHTICVKQFFT